VALTWLFRSKDARSLPEAALPDVSHLRASVNSWLLYANFSTSDSGAGLWLLAGDVLEDNLENIRESRKQLLADFVPV
jgi:hypothetical protein